MTFAQQSPLLQAIPAETIMGNAASWTREASYGTTGTRALNGSYTESAGETVTVTEALKMYGSDLDVDRFIVTTGGANIRTTHEMMKAKSLSQSVGYAIVKGSINTEGGATADAKGVHGLQARYGGGWGGTAVDTGVATSAQLVTNNGASSALSLAKLDEAIMKVDRPTHLLMAKQMRINIKTLLRNSAAMGMTEDAFGGPVETYYGLPILDADVNGDLAALAFDEGTGSNMTSVYVLNLSTEGFHLIQGASGLDVRDLGEQNDKPVWRTRMEWYIGLAEPFQRSVARLHTVANLAAVN